MSEHDPHPDADRPSPIHDDVPEEAPMEVEAPRRAASAEFEVRTEVGAEAQLRQAMDPANQSLREALRLSYRVLQVVIVVLLVVFVFSGFQQVDTQETGVMLRFGRIVGEEGREALEPGPQFNVLPYPAGEFVLFQGSGRTADLRNWFWPSYGRADNYDAAVEAAAANEMLMPGPDARGRGDGYVLTRGGDIAHIQLRGRYEIDDPVAFVQRVRDRHDGPDTDGVLHADRLVRLAMQRAVVHVAARSDLATFADFEEQEQVDVRRLAQRMLDGVDSGIRVAELQLPIDPSPALAIVRAERDLQEARNRAEERLEGAREESQATLIASAGERWDELLALISDYELAVAADDDEATEAALDAIDEAMEATSSGQVATIIQQSRAHRSRIDQSLGADARRFETLLPRFRTNPTLVVSQLWADAYNTAVSVEDTEVLWVPPNLGTLALSLSGDDQVGEVRRRQRLRQREQSSFQDAMRRFSMPPMMGADDIQVEGSGRQLDRSGNDPSTRRRD